MVLNYQDKHSEKMLKNYDLKNTTKMSLNDPLSNTLSKILNYERAGKKECIVRPSSKIILKVLEILKKENYIKDFELVDSNKGGVLKIGLLGSINKCNAIKPRFS